MHRESLHGCFYFYELIDNESLLVSRNPRLWEMFMRYCDAITYLYRLVIGWRDDSFADVNHIERHSEDAVGVVAPVLGYATHY